MDKYYKSGWEEGSFFGCGLYKRFTVCTIYAHDNKVLAVNQSGVDNKLQKGLQES